MTKRLRRRAAAAAIDRACQGALRSIFPSNRVWQLALPVGGLLMAHSAMGQTVYKPTLSDIQVTHTAGVGPSGSITNGAYKTIDVPGVLGAPPAGTTASLYPILTSVTPATYQLVNTFTNANPAQGPPSTSAYASVGETNTSSDVAVALGTGTGVTQTNPGGAYPYASELDINLKNLAYYISPAPFPANHAPQLTWNFGIGGVLPAYGSADFNVNLSFYYYKTTNQTSFSFANTNGTLLSSLSLNEPFTNTTNSTLAFSNLNTPSLYSGSVQLYGIGDQLISSTGYIDVVGSITFTASVDSPGFSLSNTGVGQGSTGDGSWTPAPSSFEIYLPQQSMISTGQSLGNMFDSLGNTDLTQSGGWTDATAGTGTRVAGPPSTNDIAQFANNILTAPQTFNLNAATTWNGLSVVNPGAAVTIASGGSGANLLTLGGLGIAISTDANNISQNLTITAPMALSASQTWDIAAGHTLTLSGSSLQLGGNTVNIQDAGNVAISAPISGAGGSFTMDGTGTLTLSGSNSFSGGLLLNSGEVSVATDSNLGGTASAISFNGGILQITGNAIGNLNSHNVNWNSFTGGFDIASLTNSVTLGAAQSIGNAATNAGSLTKLGGGTLVLSGVNTYFGPTTIGGGALRVSASNTLNPASNIIINSAQGLQIANGVILANPIVINLAGGEFVALPDAGENTTLSGSITTGVSPSAEYNLGVSNTSATLSITGASTVSGNQQATISEGNITFAQTGSLTANVSGTAPLVLGNGPTALKLTVEGQSSISDPNGAVLEGLLAGQVDTNVVVANQASINLGAGILDMHGGSVLSETNQLQLLGGAVTTGGITAGPTSAISVIDFNGGALVAGASNASFLPATGLILSVQTGGAIIDTNGFSETISSGTGFAGSAADGGLTKNGAGYLILSSGFGGTIQSSYNGPTIINGGLLEWNTPAQLGSTSAIQVNAGGAAGDDVAGASALLQFTQLLGSTSTGGLAVSSFLASDNFDYTGTVTGAFPMNDFPNMSVGAVSGGITYANTITPAANPVTGITTYQLGGGGLLKLVKVTGGNNKTNGTPLINVGGPTNLLVENGGTVWLATTNTYTGTTTINGAQVVTIPAADSATGIAQTQLEQTTLEVSFLGDAASSIGTSGAGAANLVINGGILKYVGSGDTSSRLFTIGKLGATLDASGTGALNLQNAGAEAYATSVNAPVTLTLTGSNTALNDLNAAVTDGPGGPTSLLKTGGGTWELSGSNSYSGGTVLNGGMLAITSNSNIGGASTPITFNGGILELLSNSQISTLDTHSVNWSTFNGGFDLPNGGALRIDASLQGTGSLTVLGTGTVVLSGASNTYSGGTTISSGALEISSFSQLGSGAIVDNGELSLELAAPATYSGGIAGAGGFFLGGNSVLTLNGANTFMGTTSVADSTLVLDYSTDSAPGVPILAPTSTLALEGGTLQINPNGSTAVVQSFSNTSIGSGGANAIVVNTTTLGAITLNLGSLTYLTNSFGDTVQFSAPVSGTSSSILANTTNPSAAILAGLSNGQYSGYATFGPDDWAATTASVGGSAYIVPGSAIAGFYTQLFSATSYGPTDNLDVVGANQKLTLSSPAFASLRFNTPNGGYLNDGTNNVDQVYISSVINVGAFLETPNVGQNNVLITPDNTGDNQNTQDIVLTNGGNVVFWQNNTAGILAVNTGISAGGLIKQGPGAMALNATSAYSGSTTIEAGTLEVPYDAALGSGEFIALFGGTLMAVQSMSTGKSPEIGMSGGSLVAADGQVLTLTSTIFGNDVPLTIGSTNSFQTATVNAATGNAVTFGSTIGDGTVLFAAANTGLDGPLFVNAGLLRLGNAQALGNISGITVASGATLDLNGNSQTIPSISGGGTIVGNGSSLTISGAATTLFSGSIQDGGGSPLSLTIAGSGTLALSGNNTYSGATNLEAGEVSISSLNNISSMLNFLGGVLQITGNSLQNLDGFNINTSTFTGGLDIAGATNTFSLDQTISGSGSLLKLGAGTLVLTAANSYGGGTTISAGTLVAENAGALGTGPVVNNGVLIFNVPGTVTFSGNLSGGGTLTDNSQDVVLNGSSSFPGTVNINAGSALTVASSSALSASSQVANNGLFLVNANTSIGGVSGTGTTQVAPNVTFYASGFTQSALVNNGTTTIGCGGVVGTISGGGSLTVGTSSMIGGLQVAFGGTTERQSALNVYSGSTLDMTNNNFVITYSGNDPVSTIVSLLRSGYSNGAWTGTGISSTTAAMFSGMAALGVADGASDTNVAGISSNQILIKYTLNGDANLDGNVDFTDLGIVGQRLNTTGNDWAHGNFTYASNGAVNFTDLGIVGQNLNRSLASIELEQGPSTIIPIGQVAQSEVGSSAVVLPEPSAAALAFLGGAVIMARQRRRNRGVGALGGQSGEKT